MSTTLGIFVFDDVEVLDFCGPLEVFGVASEISNETSLDLFTLSETGTSITARQSLTVKPDHSFDSAPPLDLLLVPGGDGTRPLLENKRIIEWIRSTAESVQTLVSVCTGALLLAKAGCLKNKEATTHHQALDELRAIDSSVTVRENKRIVKNEAVFCSAGVSAGIDLSLYLVEVLFGPNIAEETKHVMEYSTQESV